MGQKKKKIAAEAAKNFHRKRHEGTKNTHREREECAQLQFTGKRKSRFELCTGKSLKTLCGEIKRAPSVQASGK